MCWGGGGERERGMYFGGILEGSKLSFHNEKKNDKKMPQCSCMNVQEPHLKGLSSFCLPFSND